MRLWLRTLLGLVVVVGLSAPGRAATDLTTMQPAEIEALQKRLADDGCYAGPINGQASSATKAAVKACPDQSPVLRIETGMHLAAINKMATDASCHFVVTGSDDKTVRVWSMPEGRLLRTQRLPIGDADRGKVYAVAVSPDGSSIAAGGSDVTEPASAQHGVYIFDAATGAGLRRLGAFGNIINQLAFSPDGQRLAIALSGGHGVHVLDVRTGREIMADRDFGGDAYGVAFGPNGALFSVAADGLIRRYNASLKLTVKTRSTQARLPASVAVDPTGTRIAVGFSDRPFAQVFDAATLRPLTATDTTDLKGGGLDAVAWSSDGRRLVAGGGYQLDDNSTLPLALLTFDTHGHRLGSPIHAASNRITSILPCGDDLAFATGEPVLGLLRADSSVVTLQSGRAADMRGKLG